MLYNEGIYDGLSDSILFNDDFSDKKVGRLRLFIQILYSKSVFYAQIHALSEKKEKTGRRGLSVLCSFNRFGGMRRGTQTRCA